MIIRIALMLVLAALPVFVVVELLLWLAVPALPAVLTMLGAAMLLSGFATIIIVGLWVVLTLIVRSALAYFSTKQRTQRRFWFIVGQQDQLKRLFYFKARQISYFNELHRKRLLQHNNRTHLRSLSKALELDLLSMKAKLSETAYRQLQKDYAYYKNNQDIEALLSLQQKISTLV